ncbi:hypothetical protein C8J57DRAFT_1235569 [Mycena rebaudengoi]|nr:hypothetical protein C8J57DRAFT_1235569 [Mycena rebaudengoi]
MCRNLTVAIRYTVLGCKMMVCATPWQVSVTRQSNPMKPRPWDLPAVLQEGNAVKSPKYRLVGLPPVAVGTVPRHPWHGYPSRSVENFLVGKTGRKTRPSRPWNGSTVPTLMKLPVTVSVPSQFKYIFDLPLTCYDRAVDRAVPSGFFEAIPRPFFHGPLPWIHGWQPYRLAPTGANSSLISDKERLFSPSPQAQDTASGAKAGKGRS